jgi:hypothetical protein
MTGPLCIISSNLSKQLALLQDSRMDVAVRSQLPMVMKAAAVLSFGDRVKMRGQAGMELSLIPGNRHTSRSGIHQVCYG